MADQRKRRLPLRTLFTRKRSDLGVSWETLEKDYALSWALWGIAQTKPLHEALIFKGGTALKKAYFGSYRFSEDLDFSLVQGKNEILDIQSLLEEGVKKTENHLLSSMPGVKVEIERYLEKSPHPEGQETFTLLFQLPWHRKPETRVMIEISKMEPLVLSPVEKAIIHEYEEDFECMIKCYSLEEIISEKLRAILQNTKKYHERGWARSRVRDYYDIWSIFKAYSKDLSMGIIYPTFEKKCQIKGVEYHGVEDFFDPEMIEKVHHDWKIWLEPLVKDLPETELVLSDFKDILGKIFS